MNWIKPVTDWAAEHATILWWAFGISLVLIVVTPLLVAWLVIQLPADYFVKQRHRPLQSFERHPLIRLLAVVAKNLVGIILLVAGIFMLIGPGQGVLTIVVALILIDFPGKFRLERWMITRTNVWRSVDWLRRRAGRPSLERPENN